MANPIALADQQTSKNKQPILFSDFPMNFDLTPSGDLARIVNMSAILNSVESIVMTALGERPYSPIVGSTIAFQNFENIGPLEAEVISSTVKLAIQQNEKRVSVVSIATTNPTPNYFYVTVNMFVINNPNLISLPVLVKRDR